MEVKKVRFFRLNPVKDGDLSLPTYQTDTSSGMDVPAAVDAPLALLPGQVVLVPTGFAIAIPAGYEVQIRPRSGLAIRHGVTIINSPGTIDADYRGEVRIGLINLGAESFTINRGDRIAQMILAPVIKMELEQVSALDETKRAGGGFGHTGM